MINQREEHADDDSSTVVVVNCPNEYEESRIEPDEYQSSINDCSLTN